MKIKPVNENKFLTVLSLKEASSLLGEYEKIDFDNPLTLQALNWFLTVAYEKYGYALKLQKTVVELYQKRKNIIVSFTETGKNLSVQSSTHLYCFDNADNLLDAVFCAGEKVKDGRLYLFCDKYYIASNFDIPTLNEFGESIISNNGISEKINEHAILLSKDIFSDVRNLSKVT